MRYNVEHVEIKNSRDAGEQSDFMKNVLKCVIFVILCTRPVAGKFSNDTTPSDFVERCRRDCVIKRDTVVCGKYRVVRWLHDAVRQKEFSYGPFKIIRIPPVTMEPVLPELPSPRDLKFGAVETLSFMKSVGEDLLGRRAIVYTFEPPPDGSRAFASGPIVVDEDEMVRLQRDSSDEWRLFKKKKALILPILILLNLVKLKLMLIPIMFGVHMIKKLIVIAGLFVPGILSKLKICKVPQYSPPYHAWATAAEAPVDYPTGYGHDDPGWAHRNDLIPGMGYGYPGYPHPPYGYYRQR